jgi:hypothetical protein
VQAQYLDTCDLADHGFHAGPPCFDQVSPDLFEQVPPLVTASAFEPLVSVRVGD